MTVSLSRLIENDFEDEESEVDKRGNVRTQQPNVRINPNLMKIKMEEDCNPITVPKAESLVENVTELKKDHTVAVEPKEEAVDSQKQIVAGKDVQSQPNLSKVGSKRKLQNENIFQLSTEHESK